MRNEQCDSVSLFKSVYIYQKQYRVTICSLLEKYYVLIGKWFFILSLQKASYIKIKVDAKDIKQLVTRRCWWHGSFFSPQINLTQFCFNRHSFNECCEEVFCDILDDPNRCDITEKFNSIIFIMIFSILQISLCWSISLVLPWYNLASPYNDHKRILFTVIDF